MWVMTKNSGKLTWKNGTLKNNISDIIHNIKPTKYTNLFLRYLYHNITRNISKCFSLQKPIIGNQTKVIQHKIKFLTYVLRWHGVKRVKEVTWIFLCRVVVQMCWILMFTESWKLPTYLTHCGQVTQICVFTFQPCKTGDANLRF